MRHYVAIRQASSIWTWAFFCRRQFGGTALHLRVFGWDSYGVALFGYKS